jgi:predicted TIM-barrel fold metal-dependent hydrolase
VTLTSRAVGAEDPVFRHVLDLDSHEFMPTHLYPEYFGDSGDRIGKIFDSLRRDDPTYRDNNLTRPDIVGDVAGIDQATIWQKKGPDAPGAIDMQRRVEVLDAMGVDRQLVFPTFGFIALWISQLNESEFEHTFRIERPTDHRQIGLDGIRAHNDWVLSMEELQSRQRHVAVIPTFDLDDMLAETERMTAAGADALCISAATPPAGTSPANPKLDRFWSLVEERDIPVVLHLNQELIVPPEFFDAPEFRHQTDSIFAFNAYYMTTFSFAVENFLATMVIGGVFERHPKIRLGIIECGAQWLGPLCERMEMHWDYWGETRSLSKRPTQYVIDQVRVTPFFCEPLDVHLQRYPILEDVLCFSSDYPHAEGGVNAKQLAYDLLEPLGDEILTKYFRKNAELIMPD